MSSLHHGTAESLRVTESLRQSNASKLNKSLEVIKFEETFEFSKEFFTAVITLTQSVTDKNVIGEISGIFKLHNHTRGGGRNFDSNFTCITLWCDFFFKDIEEVNKLLHIPKKISLIRSGVYRKEFNSFIFRCELFCTSTLPAALA